MSPSNFILNWGKYYGNLQNVESMFWRADNGNNNVFLVVSHVQKWYNL
jgi:hypothetical protein